MGAGRMKGGRAGPQILLLSEISGQLPGTGPAGAFVLAFVLIRKSSYAGRVWPRRPHCFKPLHGTENITGPCSGPVSRLETL